MFMCTVIHNKGQQSHLIRMFPSLMTSESSTLLQSPIDIRSLLDISPNVVSSMWAIPPGEVICFPEFKCRHSSNNKVLWMNENTSTKWCYFKHLHGISDALDDVYSDV